MNFTFVSNAKNKIKNMETQIYQVVIRDDKNNLVFKAFVTGQEDLEIEILDFYYQKFSDEFPDISKYTVRNINQTFNSAIEFNMEKIAQLSKAVEALDYAESFN